MNDLATLTSDVETTADLARVLRELRRREARRRRGPELTYREISERTGWSVAVSGQYLTGERLPSVERFDELIRLLGASARELGMLATARERVHARRMDVAARGDDDSGQGPVTVPQMLPARVFGFTGRSRQLAVLDRTLDENATPDVVAITALAGMGGVGKTALAVHWAHRVADAFPDGQLYVNLRGYDPAEPLTTMEALGALVGGLGVGPGGMPHDELGRSALYRRLLDGRRVLVMLDNASGAEQVRPLLPVAPCLAVVTSRDDLTDLVTVDGARRVRLDVMEADDAVALLRLLIGERAESDVDGTRQLASLCGHLPLALRVAAEHVASRSTLSLSELLAELTDDESFAGLDAFSTTGEGRTDVRTVFSWSLRRLPDPAVRTFQRLGLLPGLDISVEGLAALAGVDVSEASLLADTLARAHLLQRDPTGRYSMHDLVRSYAAETAESDLSDGDRHAAMSGLIDYYLAAATVAVDIRYPGISRARPRGRPAPARAIAHPEMTGVDAAAAWLVAERSNIVRACGYAARHGWPGHVVALALMLRPFFDDGYDRDGLTVLTEALHASQRPGADCEPADVADVHAGLGFTNWRLGRLTEAVEHARLGFEESDRLGNHAGAAVSLSVLGIVHDTQGRFDEALECQRRGLEIARSAGIRHLEGNQLVNLGYTHLGLEQYDEAAAFYRQAGDVFAEIGEPIGLAEARNGMAMAAEGLGRYVEAAGHAEQAVAINREAGQVLGRLAAMDTLGSIYRRLGRLADAAELLAEVLQTSRELNNPTLVLPVLNTLGEIHHAASHHDLAMASHAEALEIAEFNSDQTERARALVGLGDSYVATGDVARARRCWQEAHREYTVLSLPAVARVAERLSRIGD